MQKQSEHLLQLMQILKLKTLINIPHYIWLLEHGHTEAIKALIDAHANIEAQNKDQETPYIWLLTNGHAEAIKALIAAHANIEAQDKDQRTPLHCGG